MAERTEKSEAEAPEKAKSKDAPEAALKFPVAQLIADAKGLLGYESYEAAGGLYGVSGEPTVEAAKARIEKWLQQPVKQEA